MAVAKPIPIRSLARLGNLIEYLENGDHSHHRLHRVHAVKINGMLNAANFVERATKAVALFNAKEGKFGRKLKIFAFYFVARFIAGTNLSPEERTYYDEGMIVGLAEGGEILAVEHENLVLRASDFNYLVPSWLEYPLRARRTNEDDYARRAQGISNQLIQDMNVARKKKGIPPIVLAQNRKLELARKRRGILIEEELAIVAESKPVNSETLSSILMELGHTVIEPKGKKSGKLGLVQKLKKAALGTQSNLITIIPRGGKKAIKLPKIALLQACHALKRHKEMALQNNPTQQPEQANPPPSQARC